MEIEPTTALTAVTLYASKDAIAKLLGPTAEYLGGEIRDFTQRRAETIAKIFRNAVAKADDRLHEEGAVPPRVLRDILNEGSFQDDDLAVEYFGGVLASSKTRLSRDDRAATFTNLIGRLSTYQLRLHFLCYTCLRTVFAGRREMTGSKARRELQLCIPFPVYVRAMEFTRDEVEQFESILEHATFGLHSEDLAEAFRYSNNLQTLGDEYKDCPAGIIFQPSVRGAELFLRAHGLQSHSASRLLADDLVLTIKSDVSILPGCTPVKPL